MRTKFLATAMLLLGSTDLAGCATFPSTPAGAVSARRAIADPLTTGFVDPPQQARPRTWWHWMNGNITKDGIAKDLAWMKSIGIGGVQNFDASLGTPQIVDKRLAYMTPEWQDAFRFAADETKRLGLELTIASSPGWSETGGPMGKAPAGNEEAGLGRDDPRRREAFHGQTRLPSNRHRTVSDCRFRRSASFGWQRSFATGLGPRGCHCPPVPWGAAAATWLRLGRRHCGKRAAAARSGSAIGRNDPGDE